MGPRYLNYKRSSRLEIIIRIISFWLEQQNYIQLGTFPTKNIWKFLCKTAIQCSEVYKWKVRMNADNDFVRFRLLHTNIEPATIWECVLDSQSLIND